MRYTIEQASDIGGVIRAARKVQNLRQDDAAGSVGVSESFMVKAERGADTVQWGKVFQILQGLGVRIVVDIPDASDALLKNQAAKASHRATVRELRAAERLLMLGDTPVSTQDKGGGAASREPDAEGVLKAARRVLASAEAARSGRSDRPGASRALEIARRVLADAEAAKVIKSATTGSEEKPND
jgi:transcriptional regulator with XRE-family HTH domain